MSGRCQDAAKDAVGGYRRGIAAASGEAGGVVGFAGHGGEVLDRGADILGGDVAAAETVDEAAEAPPQGLALVPVRVADDDRLAAAQRQAGDGGLEGHGARQAQHVLKRLVLRLIGPHAHPAERRAEGGVVDRDDALQSGRRVFAEHHLLMLSMAAIDAPRRCRHRNSSPAESPDPSGM